MLRYTEPVVPETANGMGTLPGMKAIEYVTVPYSMPASRSVASTLSTSWLTGISSGEMSSYTSCVNSGTNSFSSSISTVTRMGSDVRLPMETAKTSKV